MDSESEIIILVSSDNNVTVASSFFNGSTFVNFHILNDGVEIEVHSEGDHETHPLHGEIPVGKRVTLGNFVGLLKSLVGVNGGIRVVPEGDNLDDGDNDETEGVNVVHNTGPDNEEPDDSINVSGG